MNKLCKCKEQQYREYLDYCFYRSATDRGGIIDGMINKLKFLLKTNCHCEEKSELPDNITTADLPPVEGGKCPECGTKIPTDAYAHIFEKGAWLRSKPRIGSVTDGFVKVDVRTVEEGKMVLSSKKEEPKQECDHIVAIDEAMYPTLLSITHVKSTSTVYGILQWDFMNKLPKDYRDGVPRKYQRRFKHCLLCGIEVNWELIKESLKQSNE